MKPDIQTEESSNKSLNEFDCFILIGSDDKIYGKYDYEPSKEEIVKILKEVQNGNLLTGLTPENIICFGCKAKQKIGGKY